MAETGTNKEGSMAESKVLDRVSPEEEQVGTPVKPATVLPPAGHVLLQVELASKREARILQWTAWLLLLALVVVTIIIVAAQGDRNSPRSLAYFRGVLGVAAASVFVALVMAALFFYRVQLTRRQHKHWDTRRKSLALNAAVLIVLGTINLSCWLAGLAVATSAGCTWPFRAIALLAFFRGFTLALIILWMLIMMSSMSLKRMRPTLDSNPDEMLILDASWQAKVREHAWKVVVCSALIVMSTLVLVSRLSHPITALWIDAPTCGELPSKHCKNSTSAIFQLAFNSAIIVLCFVMFVTYAWRALRDHAKLPYSHYRLTNIFIRVQVRNGSTVLLAIVCGVMAQETSGLGTCVGFIDSQLGSLAVEVAFVVLIFVNVYLNMPAIVATSNVQAWLQEFCWTAASLDSAVAERNAEMASCKATDTGTLEPRLLRMMGLSPEAATSSALLKEPMFCFEWAVRLFYWMRLAYQFGNPDSPITKESALPLFGLHDCECMHDPEIDTKALLAWSEGGDTLVLAFRGTASKSNVWTDLRAWKTAYPPVQWRRGLPVRVHTGFYRAWTDNGFRDRFMARVQELAGSCAAPRIFLAGHSLGGALASLAAMELAAAFPDSKITVYTYGAPRVGNPQFAAEYNARIPDSWAIVNNQDPVPRIPKIGFKNLGKRVAVTRGGDIIVRPSYFERSVLERSGGSLTHHLTGNYALALAAVLKSQFFESKRLPEGEAGARALAGTLDLGGALVLEGLDMASLEDKTQMPRTREQPKASKTTKKSQLVHGKSVLDMDRQTNLPPAEDKVSPHAVGIGHV